MDEWNGKRTLGGIGSTFLSAGLVGVAALLLLAPIAGAAASGATVTTLKAPFTGATTYPSSSLSSAGCAAAKMPHAPYFKTTTGIGGFSLRASAHACSGLFGDSASAFASETVLLPLPVHQGTNVIHAKWTVNATLGSHLGNSVCTLLNTTFSYCYSAADAQLYGYAYLIDMSNSSTWFGTTSWTGASASSTIYDSCDLGNCTSNVTGSMQFGLHNKGVTWTIHAGGLLTSHAYVLEIAWYSDAEAYDYAYDATLTGAAEYGFLTAAGPGFGVTLDWVTIQ